MSGENKQEISTSVKIERRSKVHEKNMLKVHYCKFGNLPISSSSNENNMSKISP